eukprot:PhF_6_TR34131/c1_g1_i1/m.49829
MVSQSHLYCFHRIRIICTSSPRTTLASTTMRRMVWKTPIALGYVTLKPAPKHRTVLDVTWVLAPRTSLWPRTVSLIRIPAKTSLCLTVPIVTMDVPCLLT